MPQNTAQAVTSWNAAATRTAPNWGDEIFDGISTNNSFVWMVRQAGNIKTVSGGRTFTHPLLYQTNSSFAARSATATIPTPDPDIITRSEWPIRTISGSVVISLLEDAQNQGESALIGLLEEKKLEGTVSMTEVLGDELVDGTGTSPSWDSIETIISATNTTTVGGIAGSSADWQNYSAAVGGAFNTSNNGITAMDLAVRSCSFGSRGPRAIFTTSAVWGLYYISQAGNIRYYNEELADAGFQHLNFRTLPVLWDDNIDTGRMYFVDTDSLWLQVLKKGNMVTSKFRESVDQLSLVSLMYLFGNLTTGSRRTQGVVTGITS